MYIYNNSEHENKRNMQTTFFRRV